MKLLILGGAGLALTGCVAAVPVAQQMSYTVIPGQNKTEADLRADDAVCRGSVPTSTGVSRAATVNQAAVPVTEAQYYGCMASRGEAVIQQQVQVQTYPVYSGGVPYAYPAYGGYPYGYGYPYGGYPYGGYFGPYVGFGVGFGYGGFYGGRGYGGGYYHGGYGGGGYRGGGFRR